MRVRLWRVGPSCFTLMLTFPLPRSPTFPLPHVPHVPSFRLTT
jgi:hypothetical protein